MWGRFATGRLEWQRRVGDAPATRSALLTIGGRVAAETAWWTIEIVGDDADAFELPAPSSPFAVGDRALVSVDPVYVADEVGAHEAQILVRDEAGTRVASCALAGETERRDEPWIAAERVPFGEVVVGATRLGKVTVHSIEGGDELTYACALRAGEAFSCAVTSRTVEAGVSVCLDLSFTPSAEASYEDELTIAWSRASGEPLEGALVVALTGDGVLDEAEDDALDGGEGDPAGARQRATWIVPSHESVVSLGAPYFEGDTRRTQSGFSATTSAHVFLDAGATATVEADGNAWFQSHEDNAYVFAGGNMHLVSAQTVYIGGGVYAGLMAGYGAGCAPKLERDGDGNPERPSLTPMAAGFAASEISWLVLKRLASAYNVFKKSWDAGHLSDPDTKTMGGDLRTGAWKAKYAWKSAGLFLGAAATAGAYRLATTGTDAAGLSLFSEAGLNAGTPGFTTIAGSMGTFATGLNATVVGYADVALRGMFTNLTTIGDAAVIAGRDFSALTTLTNSHLLVGSRAGPATYTGASVKVGTILPDGAAPPTPELTIDAQLKLGVEALGAGAEARISGSLIGKVAVGAPYVEVSGGARTLVSVPGAVPLYTVDLQPGSLTLSDAQGALVTLLPGSVVLGVPGTQFSLAPGVADLGGMVTLTPASLTCPAAMVELL